MKKLTFLFTIAAAVFLAGSPAAMALVAPGTTFNFDLAGFNLSQTEGYFLTDDETATFGTTTTFAGAGYDGQDITISSSEAIGATTTTDTFTVITALNFLNETTISGTIIADLQLDIGDVNTGGAVAVEPPIATYTDSGSVIYGSGATPTTAAVAPNTMLASDGSSYGTAEAVNTSDATVGISTFDVHSFTYSITYNTLPIPEPSTWAMLGIGAVAALVANRRHRQAV